jgi:hypothetical protein
MRALSLQGSVFVSLLVLTAGCGLIAGVKDRTLAEGSGGSTSSGTTTEVTAVATSSTTGGQGGTGASTGTGAGPGTGGGGGSLCPPQQPGIDTVACLQKKPSNLAVDGSSLFWINEDEGTIVKAPSMSSVNSEVSTVISGQTGICGMVIADGHAYWRTSGGEVNRVSLAPGASIEHITNMQGSSCVIAASSDRVFWVHVIDAGNEVISAAPFMDLKALVDVVPNAVEVKNLDASHAPSLYWTAPNKGSIRRWDGTTLSSLATGGTPCGISVGITNLFWTNSADGTVKKSDLDLANVSPISDMTTKPCALVYRDPFLYWIEELSNGRVLRLNKGASSVLEEMGINQNLPSSIAVDPGGANVFWTNRGSGEVLRRSVLPI